MWRAFKKRSGRYIHRVKSAHGAAQSSGAAARLLTAMAVPEQPICSADLLHDVQISGCVMQTWGRRVYPDALQVPDSEQKR